MAAPITHIILALQILSLLPSHFDHKEFIVGTSFPDIRNLAKIERTKTHFEPISWNDILTAKSAFHAGMLFHNLVDILRIQHFESYFYNRLESLKYSPQFITQFPLAMKKAEDEILYSQVSNWHEISGYFDTIYDEELVFCADRNIIKKWHSLIANYLQEQPSWDRVEELIANIRGFVLSAQEKSQLKHYFESLIKDANFKQKLIDFYTHFRSFLPNTPVITPRES